MKATTVTATTADTLHPHVEAFLAEEGYVSNAAFGLAPPLQ